MNETITDTNSLSAPAAPAPIEPPKHVSDKPRVATVNLEWPLVFAGKRYDAITLRRMSAREVADFVDRLEAAGNELKLIRFPMFTDDAGAPIPDEVMDALDDDDAVSVNKAALEFFAPKVPSEWGRYTPRDWRTYRVVIRREIPWSMAEIMAMPWDEFLKETTLAIGLSKNR